MKQLALLGSTGSIGRQTLQVASHLGYPVRALAAKSNIILLEEQAHLYQPELIAVYDEKAARELRSRLSCRVVSGMEGLLEVACLERANLVVSAFSGTIGIAPTIAALECGKRVALANKEVLVSAGAYLQKRFPNLPNLIPIDSEHSALFQCLQLTPKSSVSRLILTASGGPFHLWNQEQLQQVRLEDALCHPTWQMGPKNTIDSSTLMNKGLELIEAHYLFQIPLEKIDVVIHPESVVHSFVETLDYSLLAQLSTPTMLLPIQYALTYPKREKSLLTPFDFTKHGTLTFHPPDLQRFPCLALAIESLKSGSSGYLNAANEVLVERFLKREISWSDIGKKLEKLLSSHRTEKELTLEKIFQIDAEARNEALTI